MCRLILEALGLLSLLALSRGQGEVECSAKMSSQSFTTVDPEYGDEEYEFTQLKVSCYYKSDGSPAPIYMGACPDWNVWNAETQACWGLDWETWTPKKGCSSPDCLVYVEPEQYHPALWKHLVTPSVTCPGMDFKKIPDNNHMAQVMILPPVDKDPLFQMLRCENFFGFETCADVMKSWKWAPEMMNVIVFSTGRAQGSREVVGPSTEQIHHNCSVTLNAFLDPLGSAINGNAAVPGKDIPIDPLPCVADEVQRVVDAVDDLQDQLTTLGESTVECSREEADKDAMSNMGGRAVEKPEGGKERRLGVPRYGMFRRLTEAGVKVTAEGEAGAGGAGGNPRDVAMKENASDWEFMEGISCDKVREVAKRIKTSALARAFMFTSRDAYGGCKYLLDGWTKKSKVTSYEVTDKCTEDVLMEDGSYNQKWLNDPCCNDEKRLDMCCAPRNISWTNEVVDSVDIQAIGEYAAATNTGDLALNVAMQYTQLESDAATSCYGPYKEAMNGLEDPWKILDKCFKDVEGEWSEKFQQEIGDECETDGDCWTDLCEKPTTSSGSSGATGASSSGSTKYCAVPINTESQDFVGPIVRCLMDSAPPLLADYFAYAVMDKTDTDTVEAGIAALKLEKQECHGNGRNAWKKKTEGECLKEKACNWNRDITTSDACLKPCGDAATCDTFCGREGGREAVSELPECKAVMGHGEHDDKCWMKENDAFEEMNVNCTTCQKKCEGVVESCNSKCQEEASSSEMDFCVEGCWSAQASCYEECDERACSYNSIREVVRKCKNDYCSTVMDGLGNTAVANDHGECIFPTLSFDPTKESTCKSECSDLEGPQPAPTNRCFAKLKRGSAGAETCHDLGTGWLESYSSPETEKSWDWSYGPPPPEYCVVRSYLAQGGKPYVPPPPYGEACLPECEAEFDACLHAEHCYAEVRGDKVAWEVCEKRFERVKDDFHACASESCQGVGCLRQKSRCLEEVGLAEDDLWNELGCGDCSSEWMDHDWQIVQCARDLPEGCAWDGDLHDDAPCAGSCLEGVCWGLMEECEAEGESKRDCAERIGALNQCRECELLVCDERCEHPCLDAFDNWQMAEQMCSGCVDDHDDDTSDNSSWSDNSTSDDEDDEDEDETSSNDTSYNSSGNESERRLRRRLSPKGRPGRGLKGRKSRRMEGHGDHDEESSFEAMCKPGAECFGDRTCWGEERPFGNMCSQTCEQQIESCRNSISDKCWEWNERMEMPLVDSCTKLFEEKFEARFGRCLEKATSVRGAAMVEGGVMAEGFGSLFAGLSGSVEVEAGTKAHLYCAKQVLPREWPCWSCEGKWNNFALWESTLGAQCVNGTRKFGASNRTVGRECREECTPVVCPAASPNCLALLDEARECSGVMPEMLGEEPGEWLRLCKKGRNEAFSAVIARHPQCATCQTSRCDHLACSRNCSHFESWTEASDRCGGCGEDYACNPMAECYIDGVNKAAMAFEMISESDIMSKTGDFMPWMDLAMKVKKCFYHEETSSYDPFGYEDDGDTTTVTTGRETTDEEGEVRRLSGRSHAKANAKLERVRLLERRGRRLKKELAKADKAAVAGLKRRLDSLERRKQALRKALPRRLDEEFEEEPQEVDLACAGGDCSDKEALCDAFFNRGGAAQKRMDAVVKSHDYGPAPWEDETMICEQFSDICFAPGHLVMREIIANWTMPGWCTEQPSGMPCMCDGCDRMKGGDCDWCCECSPDAQVAVNASIELYGFESLGHLYTNIVAEGGGRDDLHLIWDDRLFKGTGGFLHNVWDHHFGHDTSYPTSENTDVTGDTGDDTNGEERRLKGHGKMATSKCIDPKFKYFKRTRQWQAGSKNTQATCEESSCYPAPWAADKEECDATSYCDGECPYCEAENYDDPEYASEPGCQFVAVDDKPLSEKDCRVACGGSFSKTCFHKENRITKTSVCVTSPPASASGDKMREKCREQTKSLTGASVKQVKYQLLQCRDLSLSDCGWARKQLESLQCSVQRLPCKTKGDCNEAGRCDYGSEVETHQLRRLGGMCVAGYPKPEFNTKDGPMDMMSCEKYSKDYMAYPTAYGCAIFPLDMDSERRGGGFTNDTCITEVGGKWHAYAYTEGECEKPGFAFAKENSGTHMCCLEWFGSGDNLQCSMFSMDKSQVDCNACGGEWVSMFRWKKAGHWIQGKWKQNYKLMDRAFTPVNQWVSVVQHHKLSTFFENVVERVKALPIRNFISCRLNPALESILGVAKKEPPVPKLGEATFLPGKPSNQDLGKAYIETDASSFTGKGELKIEIKLDGSRNNLASGGNSSRRLQASGGASGGIQLTASCYSVVKHSGKTVGQLIGDCLAFQPSQELTGSVKFCATKDTSIPTNAAFSVEAFALKESATTFTILSAAATASGSKLCINVQSNGTYCPIKRYSDYTSGSVTSAASDCPALTSVAATVEARVTFLKENGFQGTGGVVLSGQTTTTTTRAAGSLGGVVQTTITKTTTVPPPKTTTVKAAVEETTTKAAAGGGGATTTKMASTGGGGGGKKMKKKIRGLIKLMVSNAADFAKNDKVKAALVSGIAKGLAGVVAEMIKILSVTVGGGTRRLEDVARQLQSTGSVTVDYEITDAPEGLDDAAVTSAGSSVKDGINSALSTASLDTQFTVASLTMEAPTITEEPVSEGPAPATEAPSTDPTPSPSPAPTEAPTEPTAGAFAKAPAALCWALLLAAVASRA